MKKCLECKNHRIIIADTNSLIILAEYCLDLVKPLEYEEFSEKFVNQMNWIKKCALDNSIHVSWNLFQTEISLLKENSAFRKKKIPRRGQSGYFAKTLQIERFKKILSGGRRGRDQLNSLNETVFQNLSVDRFPNKWMTDLPRTELNLSCQDKEIIALATKFVQSNEVEVWILTHDSDIRTYLETKLDSSIKSKIINTTMATFMKSPYICCEIDKKTYLKIHTTILETTFLGSHFKEMGFNKKRRKVQDVDDFIFDVAESTVRKREMEAKVTS